MNATHLSSSPTTWVASMLIAANTLVFSSVAGAQETATPAASSQEQPIAAVYKAQELSFQYRSVDNFYPCHELQNVVTNILRSIGARDDIDVRARNCDEYLIRNDPEIDPVFDRNGMNTRDPFNTGTREDPWRSSSRFRSQSDERGQSASVRVRLMMPVEVTPEVLKEIDKDKSRRELVSRVTGNPAAAFNDPIVFAARRAEVTLSQRTVRLRPEDCELLDQMSSQTFRKLNVRVVQRTSTCNPRQQSRIPPQMVIEALLPTGALLPMPDPEKMKKDAGQGPSGESGAKAAEPAAETPPPQPQ